MHLQLGPLAVCTVRLRPLGPCWKPFHCPTSSNPNSGYKPRNLNLTLTLGPWFKPLLCLPRRPTRCPWKTMRAPLRWHHQVPRGRGVLIQIGSSHTRCLRICHDIVSSLRSGLGLGSGILLNETSLSCGVSGYSDDLLASHKTFADEALLCDPNPGVDTRIMRWAHCFVLTMSRSGAVRESTPGWLDGRVNADERLIVRSSS